jgi:hypothetical protein
VAAVGCHNYRIVGNKLVTPGRQTYTTVLTTFLKRRKVPDMTFNLSTDDAPNPHCVGFCGPPYPLIPHGEFYPFWSPRSTSSPVSVPFWTKKPIVFWRGAYNGGTVFGRTAIIQAAREFGARVDVGYRCNHLG